ncbi:NAD-dependent epimerase/dehydratase family protein [Rhizobium sp. AQ_MP]|jgi:nucleoside-diphosphate-sugar epimerase|uniref:NAD-dependent epimerase/dehydratase family protein n=1 Tax=Rhizobium sp. AQ_MP TaxID=2761536 RepID=UPI00163ACE01|nr:NAD-dependent epimerase/dehydratase family protein [Rhizobium sp. AQ_MP]MBC2774697.1 NAD-dependent epimerase/dehydratase family protein [Rhizobium sp. AQ_MP]
MGLTLITGASGFVGSHLVADMRSRNMPIRPVSRSEHQGSIKIGSYAPATDWRPYLDDVETVVHLAARVHVMRETDADPLAAFRLANVATTINLARQSAKAGVKRFIFMSTIKVNGEKTEPGRPFKNSDRPNPQDPYAISKAEAEAELWKVASETGIEITVVRPPLVYGPGVGGNFRTLTKWVNYGIPSVFANINNKRSLIYVGNLTDFLMHVLGHPKAKNKHFLVSDGQPVSTHRLMDEIARAEGKKLRSWPLAEIILYRAGWMFGLEASVKRLMTSLEIDDSSTRSSLGWHQPHEVREALRMTSAFGRLS